MKKAQKAQGSKYNLWHVTSLISLLIGFLAGLFIVIWPLAKLLGPNPNRFVVLLLVPLIVAVSFIPGVLALMICMYAWKPFLTGQEVQEIVIDSADPALFGRVGEAFIKLAKYIYKNKFEEGTDRFLRPKQTPPKAGEQ